MIIERKGGGGGGGPAFTGDLAGNALSDSTGSLTLDGSFGGEVVHDVDGVSANNIIMDIYGSMPSVRARTNAFRVSSASTSYGLYLTNGTTQGLELFSGSPFNCLRPSGGALLDLGRSGTEFQDVYLDGSIYNSSDQVIEPAAASSCIVRQNGGTPGTDEVQISHSGTYGLIESKQGQLVLTGSNAAGTTVSIQEGGANVCEFKTSINTYKSLVSFNANADIGVGGAYRDLNISGQITNSGDQVIEPGVASSVIVRQNGGTPGTDEVQISHDGSDAKIEAMSGYMRVEGSSHIELIAGNNIIFQSDSGTAVIYKPFRPLNNGQTLGNTAKRFETYATDIDADGQILTGASTTSKSSLRLPHGSAPTSPVDGDMWTTTAGLFVRINGVTKTVTLT